MPIACKERVHNGIDRYYNVFGGCALFLWFFSNVFDRLGNFSGELLKYRLKSKAKAFFIPLAYTWKYSS
ncbi:MAG: hypothetical protein P4L10_04340 [Acidobacteriaceae bacterium]|nr:hypothetical protein [Acidobacteriaceae bacterium]